MALVDSGVGQKQADQLGLPAGFAVYTPYPFGGPQTPGGQNQQDDRAAMADTEFYVIENFVRIGEGYLRTLWDRGSALYTAPTGKTIVKFQAFNIGPTNYFAVFLSDGTAIQVDMSGNQTVMSSTTGTFYNGGATPDTSQWGSQYLLISTNIAANGYWAWDGKLLYGAGGISPVITINGGGSGYSSVPTATAFGGEGSGIAVTPVITNGSVTSLTVTSAGTGYVPEDVVQFQFSGGGTDTGPELVAVLAVNTVQSVNVLAGGHNYVSGDPVVFTGGGGTGAAATATISGGAVTTIVMTSGGAKYTSPPVVSVTSTSGAGFTGAAYLTAGSVASITVVSGGSNFTAIPTLSFSGGGGSGAAGTVNLSGGSTGTISSVSLSSGGTNYTSPPAVIVSPGQNNAAYATAALMPFVVNGYAIETFNTRVWLANTYSSTATVQNGGVILTSAPGSLSDFATSDGGNTYTSNEPFLRQAYGNLKQAQGYLYTFADSACDVISNVQTTGSPTSTTFNYQNVDPQTGIAWRDTAAYFGLSVLFANAEGAFGLYGGAVQPISKKVTRLFDSAVFPPTAGAVTPSAAVANLHTVKCYLLNMTITDPLTGLPRTVMLGWDQAGWFTASQSSTLTYIGTQGQNSSYTAWGTDGATLFPLFSAASAGLTKTISTKLYGGNSFPVIKQALGLWMMTGDVSANKAGVSMAITMDTEGGSTALPLSPVSFGGLPMLGTATGDVYGAELGITAQSSSPDFVLKNCAIGYIPVWGGFGDPPALSGT